MKNLFIFFLLVLMVSACGMQGDLYLPDEESANRANTTNTNNAVQQS